VVLESGAMLYEHVVRQAQTWASAEQAGLVVGATHPEALQRVRVLAPQMWFLAPGVGAQGGNLADALTAGLRADGLGILVAVSRGISRAADLAEAAQALTARIREFWAGAAAHPMPVPRQGEKERGQKPYIKQARALRETITRELIATGCVRFGEFTLKSGLQSPIYIDLRLLASFPRLLAQVAAAYADLLDDLAYDRLAALPYAALPIGTAVSLHTGDPLIYPRKETKAYGTRASIEGEYHPGERVVMLDDLATTGGSKLEAAEKLRGAGLAVSDVVVLIDRQSGAREELAAHGLRLHAVFTLRELLAFWKTEGLISPEQAAQVRAFLQAGA